MIDTQTAKDLTEMITAITSKHDLAQDARMDMLNAWFVILSAITLGCAVVILMWIRDIKLGRWVEDPLWKERRKR